MITNFVGDIFQHLNARDVGNTYLLNHQPKRHFDGCALRVGVVTPSLLVRWFTHHMELDKPYI